MLVASSSFSCAICACVSASSVDSVARPFRLSFIALHRSRMVLCGTPLDRAGRLLSHDGGAVDDNSGVRLRLLPAVRAARDRRCCVLSSSDRFFVGMIWRR